MNNQSSLFPAALIRDLHNGSEDALKAVLVQFGGKLFNYCRKNVKHQEDAEDLMQEILIKVWQFRKEIDETANFEILLFTIARNHLLNFARKQTFTSHTITGEIENYHLRELESLQRITYKETYLQYQAIMEKLGPKSREVFELSREAGLSNKEIAEKLGISIRTVETHVSNVLKVLRGEMKDSYFLLCILLFY